MANWDNEFDLKPKGTDLVGEMDDYIRATRQEVRIRMAKEHLFDLTSSTTQGHQGLARMGSARVWFSDTTPAAPTPASDEADNDGTSGRLWVVTSSGTPTGEIKVYSGSAWVSMGSFAPAALLTAIKTVDGSGSGLDADLLDGNHSTAFATAAQGTKADNAAISTTVEAGSAIHAGSVIKTKILQGTFSGNGSISHGISDAVTNHRILNISCMAITAYGEIFQIDPNAGFYPTSISYTNTDIRINRTTGTSLTYDFTITYV